ncbi:MAG: 4Fe-4S binding protein [Thermoleophilia bacterium]|nr:4Fe-4S binding protein [Thermoleophilia bacterium]
MRGRLHDPPDLAPGGQAPDAARLAQKTRRTEPAASVGERGAGRVAGGIAPDQLLGGCGQPGDTPYGRLDGPRERVRVAWRQQDAAQEPDVPARACGGRVVSPCGIEPAVPGETSASRASRRPRPSRRSRPRHGTDHVAADTRLCEACGECVEACPRGVLSVKGPSFHRHVRFDHPEECRGCGKCVEACPHGAMVLREHDAMDTKAGGAPTRASEACRSPWL